MSYGLPDLQDMTAKGDRAVLLLESLHHHVRDLAGIAVNLERASRKVASRRIPGQGVADATGVCDIPFDFNSGADRDLRSIAWTSAPAAANLTVALYLGDGGPGMNLIWGTLLGYAAMGFQDLSTGELLRDAQRVTVRFTGQPPGQVCTAVLKVNRFAEDPC